MLEGQSVWCTLLSAEWNALVAACDTVHANHPLPLPAQAYSLAPCGLTPCAAQPAGLLHVAPALPQAGLRSFSMTRAEQERFAARFADYREARWGPGHTSRLLLSVLYSHVAPCSVC